MRALHVATAATTMTSVAFQISLTIYPEALRNYAWSVKYLWIASIILWILTAAIFIREKLLSPTGKSEIPAVKTEGNHSPAGLTSGAHSPISQTNIGTLNVGQALPVPILPILDSTPQEKEKPNIILPQPKTSRVLAGQHVFYENSHGMPAALLCFRNQPIHESKVATANNLRTQIIYRDESGQELCDRSVVSWLGHTGGPVTIAPGETACLIVAIIANAKICAARTNQARNRYSSEQHVHYDEIDQTVRQIEVHLIDWHGVQLLPTIMLALSVRNGIPTLEPLQSSCAKRSEKSPRDDSFPGHVPRIVSAGHGSMIPGQWRGLIIVNDGEPAYDVSFGNIHIGKSKMVFTRGIQRLTKEDGKVHCEYWIEQDSGTGVPGGLFEEMVRHSIDAVELPIRYKDCNNQWYETTVQLERDVMAQSGIYTRYIAQKKITQPV